MSIEYKSTHGNVIVKEENGVVTCNGEFVCTAGQLKWMLRAPGHILSRPFYIISKGIEADIVPEPVDLWADSTYSKAILVDHPGSGKFLRYMYKYNGIYWAVDSDKQGIMFGVPNTYSKKGTWAIMIHTDTPEEAQVVAHRKMVSRYGEDYMTKQHHEMKRIDL